jgi:hypothetical protein
MLFPFVACVKLERHIRLKFDVMVKSRALSSLTVKKWLPKFEKRKQKFG